jgi:hypothetical protein
MKFKNILAEQLMLMEDVAKAEKILKIIQVPLDDPDYVAFKQRLAADNSIGFLGIIINLVYNTLNDHSDIQKIITDYPENKVHYLERLWAHSTHIYEKLKANRQDLSLLPKKLTEYIDLLDLEKDINLIQHKKNLKKFYNIIPDKNLRTRLINGEINLSVEISYYFREIEGTPAEARFKSKLSRYKTPQDLKNYLASFIKFHKLGVSYDSTMEKVKSSNDLRVVYDKDEKLLVLVNSFEGLRLIGSPSWCIYDSKEQYANYTADNRNQYVFFNFDENTDENYVMIGFTMNGDQISASHLMDDTHIDNVINYLNSIGVYPKFKSINNELERIKRDKQNVDKLIKDINQLLDDEDMATGDKQRTYQKAVKDIVNSIVGDIGLYMEEEDYNFNVFNSEKLQVLTNTYKDLFTKYLNDLNNTYLSDVNPNVLVTKLANMIKFLQNYVWIKFQEYSDGDGGYEVFINGSRKINLIHAGFFNRVKKTNGVKTALKKIFVNLKELEQETYRNLTHELMTFDVPDNEINELIRLRKTKHGGEYSHTEFYRIKDKANLSSTVLNKIQRARRGEDVEISFQEVEYGIKKGLKSSLVNYYRSILPQFMEQQVDLDDSRIYRSLGLGGELKKIIQDKYNMMGGDDNPYSINSIEKSILDVG